MLTLRDFKEKKIVFISNFGDVPNDLKFGNSNIRLYKNDEFVDQISCYLVLSIFIIGETTLTTTLIRNASEYGISIFLLNTSYKMYANILSKAEGNYKIRKLQYTSSRERELNIAKKIVKNKLLNQIKLKKSEDKIVELLEMDRLIDSCTDLKVLLGIEGNTASNYFESVFGEYGWYRRAPRTKEDIINLLLDIGYTFLFNYVDSLLNLFGFDTFKGFYHQLFFNRKSLSCDLMEPMRPLIDKQLIKSLNLKQISEEDFKFDNGSFGFKPGCGKKYTSIWLDLIMDNRVEIYNYILGFYRYLLYPQKYTFPIFKIQCS